ncbi:MAG: anthranilate phosphoribosyltransferase [Candidatus Firestonebacteria bacterium]|nr:anthranilate phosphoribosyltransferase [Candidatus Firestonebacteria bacterium]
MIKDIIKKIVDKENLTIEEAYSTMLSIMNGETTSAQIACFITALRMKGETVEEITGCARAMREKAVRINVKKDIVVDTCGTGGDGGKTFNVSTACAIVAAGAGLTVAKHGNKAVSSLCGSADVLTALGVNIQSDVKKTEECINTIGIGFLFAPLFHTAMKHAIGPRQEIGIRTIFNILGPLTNPAGAHAQVLGVFSESLTEKLAGVLSNLGVKNAFVVHSNDGLDEISISSDTKISEVKHGKVSTYYINPEKFGINKSSLSSIQGGNPQRNAEIIHNILNGEKSPYRDIVILNSACVIAASGMSSNISGGIKLAEESIDSGKAKDKLEQLIKFTTT